MVANLYNFTQFRIIIEESPSEEGSIELACGLIQGELCGLNELV